MKNLHESDSVAKHNDAVKRHHQLCRQNKQGEKYITYTQSEIDRLEACQKEYDSALFGQTMTMDKVRLCDMILDDTLRTLKGRAFEYDRDHPGEAVREMLLPGGNLLPLIRLPYMEEPDAAAGIVQKIRSLGEDHPLAPVAAEIEEALTSCRQASEEYKNAVKKKADAGVALELAKVALRKKYALAYFTAAAEMGKAYAERLFPEIHGSSRNIVSSEDGDEAAA